MNRKYTKKKKKQELQTTDPSYPSTHTTYKTTRKKKIFCLVEKFIHSFKGWSKCGATDDGYKQKQSVDNLKFFVVAVPKPISTLLKAFPHT